MQTKLDTSLYILKVASEYLNEGKPFIKVPTTLSEAILYEYPELAGPICPRCKRTLKNKDDFEFTQGIGFCLACDDFFGEGN